MVLTAEGLVAIESIAVGDMVIANDSDTGETTEKEVVETYVNETEELIHVWVDGEEIITTPTHPFYVPEKGWTSAVELKAGDQLQLVNGEYVVIEAVEHELLEEPVKVYNFQVEDFHTYYVGENNSVLVHNKCRPSYKKVKIDIDEVVSGHTSNGNRAIQSGIKDLFPDWMDEKQIEKEIRTAFKDAQQIGSAQYDGTYKRIKLQGHGKNGVVEMWYNETTQTIETAYPIYGNKVKIE